MSFIPSSPHAVVRSRRWVLGGVGLTTASAVLTACGGGDQQAASKPAATASSEPSTDFAARFAQFEPAEEPNGDLEQVVWPEFVTDAGPEIQRLYAFQVEHGHIMRYMPCFCGCHLEDGHRNNRDCYVEAVHPDGSVAFDPMVPSCGVCLGVTRAVIDGLDQGLSPRAIRAAIDTAYADQIEMATPTPYPPEEL